MSAVATEITGVQLLPWAVTFLDYTDAVVASLPRDEAALDWRPADAAGGWYLSIREQAMHIADERHDARWLSGEDPAGRLFMEEYGGTQKPWRFKPATRDQILESLAEGRAVLDAVLARPHSCLLETTDRLRAKHEEQLVKLRADGKEEEARQREARGPLRVINQVLFLIAHEQSHRAVLQGMLRQRGHDVVRYA